MPLSCPTLPETSFFIKLKKAIFLAPFEYKKKPGYPGFFLSFFDRRNLKDTVTYPRKVFKYVFSNYLKIPRIAMPIAIRTSNTPCMICAGVGFAICVTPLVCDSTLKEL